MKSRLYQFILNNWLMGRDEGYVDDAFKKGYITEPEKETILATPRI